MDGEWTASLTLLPLTVVEAADRSYDGTGNSTENRGAANHPFLRLSATAYSDGTSDISLRPTLASMT